MKKLLKPSVFTYANPLEVKALREIAIDNGCIATDDCEEGDDCILFRANKVTTYQSSFFEKPNFSDEVTIETFLKAVSNNN